LRNHDQPARRGLVYWPGDAENGPRILFGSGEWFYAADPRTGKLLPNWGTNGRTEIPSGATVSGAVYKHVFVTAGVRGDVYGYDVRNGKMLWRFSTVAQGGETGPAWSTRLGSANGWSGMSVDDQRGLAFVSIGAPHPDMVGIDRPGDNLYSNCILAD
jgi:quinoprotein glucose dehydrogenase